MKITLKNTDKNMTPLVVDAVNKLIKTGGELHFEKGEYHFYKEGSLKRFFGVSNNSACDKYIVFPILDTKDITVDGHGSVFVFHDISDQHPCTALRTKAAFIRSICYG